jgi:hypothetical protein
VAAVIDTNQIYDRCHCGARVMMIKWGAMHVAKCSECAEVVGPFKTPSEAMVAWNKTMREMKK